MENWKEIFASFGLWSLVEDISDDGDGEGDNLQLTKDGELFVSEIQQELDKAREEGYEKGVKDGLKGKVFKKVHLTEEYRPFKNRGELEEFLKNTVTNWDEIFKVTEEAEWQKD